MKYLILFFFLTPVSTLCQTNQSAQIEDQLTISGEISNASTPPRYIYVIYADTEGGIDSSLVTNNKFRFSKKIATTTLLTLYAADPRDINNLREENMLTIETEPTHIKIHSGTSLSNSVIVGSKANEERKVIDELDRPFYQALSPLFKKKSRQEALKNADSAAFWKDEINKETYKLANFYYQYIISNPKSYLKLFLIADYLRTLPTNVKENDIDKIDTLFHLLSPSDKKSILGKKVERKIESLRFGVGSKAPNFTLNDVLGNAVSLKDLKQKYLLIDFWASWCGPCRRENKNLVEVYKKYKKKGFSIVSISLDEYSKKEDWMKAIKNDGLIWTQLSDLKGMESPVARLYKVAQLPQNFLVDANGIIIAKDLYTKDLEEFLGKK
ncbi:redoxin domain-containing protein [Niabella hirudinis]|uniref:redoxin domain-containing protein n=1 Tax=Niabella hirudinis TaxID=1285929 RepID=UPI003EB8BE85